MRLKSARSASPTDRQRLAVRGEERVVVEYDAAVVDADRVGRQPERRADHRYADFGLCEVHAPVQPRPVSGASCVDFRLQPAGEADEVVGQEHVGLLQRESGDRRREVERAFALCAVISPDGQYLGAVERQPRIGHMSLILLVIESEVDVAEAPFVVRQFRDGQVAAQGQAVGRHAQRHVRTQYPVDGRGGGQQPQCGTDVQAGDIQPDVVGRPPLREPSGLRTAGRRASCRGRRRCFCHTCKRGNCRGLPSRVRTRIPGRAALHPP